ncbi:PKD domain-containing protein [Chitinophaga sp. CF118]|uniref:PKD domain-containing protein n=1 Tax=Chitinophaga sp. CF118 TaxID=1884367 RepID=UPI0008F31A55|nr:PKD domain-containing protein [Chitinophaga sp. CF118]SFD57870.1 PKD domain-containing protein [Chitinophaga sp. CF118]
MKNCVLLFCIIFICKQSNGQTVDSIPAQVNTQETDNRINFSADLRPLRGVAGAPSPFYSYFWEFGDGTFSFEKTPQHIYRDTGSYEVRLYATNNYDDGKPPPTRPRPVRIKNKSIADINGPSGFFKGGGAIEMKVNRMPRPGEEMVLLIGYRQSAITVTGGSLLLMYNEKQFKQDNFTWQEVRTHHQEKDLPADSLWAYMQEQTVAMPPMMAKNGPAEDEYITTNQQVKAMVMEQMYLFRKSHIWRMEKVQPGAEQFMFVSLQTTPEMVKDTNAVVSISALFIPDDPSAEPEQYVLELPVVASHDPNRMIMRNRRMNYRFTGKKRTLTYKVQFQNTGKGPASKVDLGIRIPDMLDGGSVELADMQPKCIPCATAYEKQSCVDTVHSKDSIHFILRNIYLPGIQQEGVHDEDSTKGFIKYTIHFGKRPAKKSFTSRAAIVFDQNEPVITNHSTGRFIPGISPGIIMGYTSQMGDKGSWKMGNKSFTLGASLSPYAPHHQYLQIELYASAFNEYELYQGRREGGDTVINNRDYKVRYRDKYERVNVVTLEAVPVQLRYNVNSWLGAGVGMMAALNISKQTKHVLNTYAENANLGLQTLTGNLDDNQSWFTGLNPGVFGDIQLGRVRTGPAAGIRYQYYLNPAQQRLYVYATWRL